MGQPTHIFSRQKALFRRLTEVAANRIHDRKSSTRLQLTCDRAAATANLCDGQAIQRHPVGVEIYI